MLGELIDVLARRNLERRITQETSQGTLTFFDEGFLWVAEVEKEWRLIRREFETVLAHRDRIPNFQDISADQVSLTQGDEWKTFILVAYGRRIEQNCLQCPDTMRILQKIPGMLTAMFSILAPRTHIPKHRGPFKGVLRYHLGLMIPSPNTQCRICAGNEIRSWVEGKSMIFDDTFAHEVWNDAATDRAILFVDFIRPLPAGLDELNRALIQTISESRFVTQMVEGANLGSAQK